MHSANESHLGVKNYEKLPFAEDLHKFVETFPHVKYNIPEQIKTANLEYSSSKVNLVSMLTIAIYHLVYLLENNFINSRIRINSNENCHLDQHLCKIEKILNLTRIIRSCGYVWTRLQTLK